MLAYDCSRKLLHLWWELEGILSKGTSDQSWKTQIDNLKHVSRSALARWMAKKISDRSNPEEQGVEVALKICSTSVVESLMVGAAEVAYRTNRQFTTFPQRQEGHHQIHSIHLSSCETRDNARLRSEKSPMHKSFGWELLYTCFWNSYTYDLNSQGVLQNFCDLLDREASYWMWASPKSWSFRSEINYLICHAHENIYLMSHMHMFMCSKITYACRNRRTHILVCQNVLLRTKAFTIRALAC